MKKNVLFIITIPSQFKALSPIIDLFKGGNIFNPIVLFDENRHALRNEIEYCKKNGIDFLNENNIIPKKIPLPSEESSKNNTKADYIGNSDLTKSVSFKSKLMKNNYISYFSFIYNTKKRAKKILLGNSIAHVISGADVEMEVSSYISVANLLKIKSWVYPFSLSSQIETISSVISYNDFRVKNIFALLFLKLFFKKWLYKSDEGYFIRQEFYRILPMELLRVSPIDPWIYIGGKSSFVFVESEFVKNYYSNAGINKNKFVEIGAPFLCKLSEKMREMSDKKVDLFNKYGLNPSKKVVLCALPPVYLNPEEKYLDSNEYDTCGEMVNDWITTITSNNNYQAIVNLHPRSDFDKVKYVEKLGVKIINEDISSLIPMCDLFVANASATIRMALACNKPVLDYDMQKFCYPNYENLALVYTVYDKINFRTIFHQITNSDFFEVRIKQFGNLKGNYFGELNCSFNEKIYSVMNKAA